MSDDAIRTAVIAALLPDAARAHPDATAISAETRLGSGGLGISSLTLLQAFVALEQRFNIVFDDGAVAAARFETVGDFQSFIERSLKDGVERHGTHA